MPPLVYAPGNKIYCFYLKGRMANCDAFFSSVQFSSVQHAKINVVLINTSGQQNQSCSLRTVLPTEKLRLQ